MLRWRSLTRPWRPNQTVLKIKPDKAAAYTNIGVVYYQSGKFDEAVQQMQKALELDPNECRDAVHARRDLRTSSRSWTRLKRRSTNAVELKPDLAAAYTVWVTYSWHARTTQMLSRCCKRRRSCSRIKLKPWLALGQAYAAQGNKTEASTALSKCQQTSQPGPLQSRCQQLLQQLAHPDGVIQSKYAETGFYIWLCGPSGSRNPVSILHHRNGASWSNY